MSDKMWVTQVTHQQLAYQILCHLSLFSAINKYTHMIYMCVCVFIYISIYVLLQWYSCNGGPGSHERRCGQTWCGS